VEGATEQPVRVKSTARTLILASDRCLARTVGAVGVAILGVTTRWYALSTAPAEWYGDISTVYEYVLALRAGDLPPGFYSLGIGPLYPQLVRPFLAVFGPSYDTIKFAGSVYSLIGLAVLFELTRRLRSFELALLTVAVASVSSGWLIYSRLGDVQALTPTLTIAVVTGTVVIVRHPRPRGLPVVVGVLAGSGLYLYGNTWVLPLVPLVPATVQWLRGRMTPQVLALLVGAVVATVLPIVVEFVGNPDAFTDGHAGQRFVGWRRMLPDGLAGLGRSFSAYTGSGDQNYRGNPSGAPHLDQVSALFALVGVAAWLAPARRQMGLFLIGVVVLLHVPVSLAERGAIPSVGRTVAAAPLIALFVATGVWTVAAGIRCLGASIEVATLAVVAIVGVIAWANIDRYVNDYLPGLPAGNTAVAGAIVELAHMQPGAPDVHLVGSGWGPGRLPEPKSIAYQLDPPQRLVEHDPDEFTCATVELIARPALLVWSPERASPAAHGVSCADELGRVVRYQDGEGRSVFHAVVLREP
jgi:hypothetical protein